MSRLTSQEASDVLTGGGVGWVDDWGSVPLDDVAEAARIGVQSAADALRGAAGGAK